MFSWEGFLFEGMVSQVFRDGVKKIKPNPRSPRQRARMLMMSVRRMMTLRESICRVRLLITLSWIVRFLSISKNRLSKSSSCMVVCSRCSLRFETVEIISGIEGATHLNKNLTIGQATGMADLNVTGEKREEVFFYVVLISCLIRFHSSDSVLTSPLRRASRSLSRMFRNCGPGFKPIRFKSVPFRMG